MRHFSFVGIDVHEVTEERDDLLDAHLVVCHETEAELNPDDPPVSRAERAGELFAATTHKRLRSWVALLDGSPAGVATFELEDDDANRHIAASDWIAVRPVFRRKGVADALLGVALDVLAAEGRTSLQLWAPQRDEDIGRVYAERLGLSLRLEERCSRVRSADLEEDVIGGWLAEAESRTDGYRLVELGDVCPEEYLDPYLEAITAMDDMPTDDLDWSVAPTDEELVRSREEAWRRRGYIVARTLALAPDGSGAGFSELFVSRHRPQLAHQGDTGVVPAHRGHGLGRWLKAANLRTAQRLAPGFDVIETYNAQSNPWMLDINVAMGFAPHVVWRAFQGDLATARARLP